MKKKNDWSDLDTTIAKCGSYRAGCTSLAGFQERSTTERGGVDTGRSDEQHPAGVALWNEWIASLVLEHPCVIDLDAYRARRAARAEAEAEAEAKAMEAFEAELDELLASMGEPEIDDEPESDGGDDLASHIRAINAHGFAVTLSPLG
ncbi:MAG: hypothetical protein JJ863_17580 [Deltaproteobacteria bacterium]|nr:hypothetical protein [Deltaproteobacteria bacterium]